MSAKQVLYILGKLIYDTASHEDMKQHEFRKTSAEEEACCCWNAFVFRYKRVSIIIDTRWLRSVFLWLPTRSIVGLKNGRSAEGSQWDFFLRKTQRECTLPRGQCGKPNALDRSAMVAARVTFNEQN